jgi:DNA-directed RNA polymerase beta' subunit
VLLLLLLVVAVLFPGSSPPRRRRRRLSAATVARVATLVRFISPSFTYKNSRSRKRTAEEEEEEEEEGGRVLLLFWTPRGHAEAEAPSGLTMSIYNQLAYNAPVARIRGLQFGLMGPDEIKRRSVVEVTSNEAYNGLEPVPHGLFDPRMGVIDNNSTCATCLQRNTFCPGHFGHVVLARPMFYVQFFETVRRLLRCVCFRCSKLLKSAQDPEVAALLARKGMARQKRWEQMVKLCGKVRRCGQETVDGCGAKQPAKIVRTDDMKLLLVWSEADVAAAAAAAAEIDAAGEGGAEPSQRGGGGGGEVREQLFNAEDVLRVLRQISDADAEMLGFAAPELCRPEWMICTVLPVPPPAVRPSVRPDSGVRQEDDLTATLSNIVKANNTLRDKIARGKSHDMVENYANLLQYHISTMIDNSQTSMYHTKDRAGRLFRSLVERLKHKEGRIRGNLLGKRVDFSARTVITPDPNLSIDELGVPFKIAMNLTFPEVVNRHNAAELRRLVLNGPDTYPGAKHVRKTRQGNRTIRLRGHVDPASIELEDGDVVERHLRNGDYVLFNRQPSLHKMSMMAHRVRVMDYSTFRLNVCVCASYNADFDGDEMNMHVPQSLQTHHELAQLAAVPLHILSPRYSWPIITIVQDVALGVYRITQPHVRISQRQLFNLACSNPLFDPAALPAPAIGGDGAAEGGGVRAWTGRQAISTVLPPGLTIEMASGDRKRGDDDYVHEDDWVVVRDGELRQGVLSAKVFKAQSRGLVHAAYNTLGPQCVTAMLNNTQKLICDWLVLSGFSCGVSDLVIDAATAGSIRDALRETKAKVYGMIQQVHAGAFENASTKSDAEFLETEVGNAMKAGVKTASGAGLRAFARRENRMLNMIRSGSKGGPTNFQQMVSCLGQQTIENRRVPDGFDGRTLPHFAKFDDGPESRGFVEHSFIEGLTPQEFFFHSMAGRIGLIDTAVRTSETGYLQRKLVKAMEDCKVQHDMTVRNASGHIVQFLYGEDGMDAVKLEYQSVPYANDDDGAGVTALRDAHLLTSAEELRGVLRDDLVDALAADEASWRPRFEAHYGALLADRRFVIADLHGGEPRGDVVYPVHVQRLVETAAQLFRAYGPSSSSSERRQHRSDADPRWVLDQLDALLAELVVGAERRPPTLLGVLLRCHLSPKLLIARHRLPRAAIEHVLRQVRAAFYAAIAEPGEMVGIVAAQSLGEPCTQLSSLRTSRVLISWGGSHDDDASGNLYTGEIGAFVDALLAKHADRVVDLGGDSVVLDTVTDDLHFSIVGVSNDEKTSWRRIRQVSRHPANGGIVRIRTRSGKTTCATLSHSFLRRTESGIEPVRGSELKVGDRTPVAKSIPVVAEPLRFIAIGDVPYELTRQLGWFFGAFLADGSVSKHGIVSISKVVPEYQDALRDIISTIFHAEMKQSHKQAGTSSNVLHGWDMSKYHGCENRFSHPPLADFLRDQGMVGSHAKRVPAWMFAANLDFVRGVLCGYFDGDGNVNDQKGKQMIRSASVCEGLTEDVILLLAYVGIFASKCRETHLKEPDRADLHSIQVPRKHARRFREQVGPLVVKSKAEALDNVVAYVEREDLCSRQEQIDMIPELGDAVAFVGMNLPGLGPARSRTYGRFAKKEAIGRETLRAYIADFERAAAAYDPDAVADALAADVATLERFWMEAAVEVHGASREKDLLALRPEDGALLAATGSALKEAVPSTAMAQWAKATRIGRGTLRKYLDAFAVALEARRACDRATFETVQAKMAVLRQAAESDVVWDEIVEVEHLPDPQEYVYDFTVPGNDSFMVDCGVLVHNTLNSVEHGTELLLRVRGALERVTIGDFVDGAVVTASAAAAAAGGCDETVEEARRCKEVSDTAQAEAEDREGGGQEEEDAADSSPTSHLSSPSSLSSPPQVDDGGVDGGGDDDEAAEDYPVAPPRTFALERHPHDTTLVWLKEGGDDGPTPSEVEVLSVDEAGRVSWREVTALTRHPVVNADGSDTLLRVVTRGGREVTATAAKSFLARRDNRIVCVPGDELRVGHFLPVARSLPLPPALADRELTHLDVSRYLPKTEFTYSSEVAKALAAEAAKPSRHWWGPARARGDFVLPYGRSDVFLEAAQSLTFEDGLVYPKKRTRTTSRLPEALPLDADFGFFLGAFLADGCVAPSQVHISKNEPAYRERVTRFCDRYGFGWHFTSREVNGGRSETVVIHSTLLTRLVHRMCGRLAHNKRFPAPLLAAAREPFLAAVVGGYFAGDGCVSGGQISASSVSNGLLQDMRNILLRFGITGTIYMSKTTKKQHHHLIGTLYINSGCIRRFFDAFDLGAMPEKQHRLATLAACKSETTPEYARNDVVPDLVLSAGTVATVHRDRLQDMLAAAVAAGNEADRAVIEAALAEEVAYDEIVSIERVPNPRPPYVYDLTVRDTRTFAIYSGLMNFDTFHLSGVQSASAVTRGVPRMRELMSMSKAIKTPAMTVRVRREWAASRARCEEIMSRIQTTRFRDLVMTSSVLYEPAADEAEEGRGADAALMRFHRASAALDANAAAACAEAAGAAAAQQSPWLLRFEFDRARMLDLNVSMLDLEHALREWLSDAVTCVFSDDNAATLVGRVRLAPPATASAAAAAAAADGSDLLTELKALEQSVLEKTVVKGVRRIEKAVVQAPGKLKRYDPASDAFEQQDEHYIETAGSNLVDVMGIDAVDFARTHSNDVYEVYCVLGVEAARQALLNELLQVLQDLPLNHRHLSLLADTMCNRGFFMSIDRHGINSRGELGPLSRASFEQSPLMLINAGIFSERDRINGVSANIMLGQVAPCGTGDSDLLLDCERLARLAQPVPTGADAAGADQQDAAAGLRGPRAPGERDEDEQQREEADARSRRGAAPLPMLALPDELGAAAGAAAGAADDADAARKKGKKKRVAVVADEIELV